MKLITISDLFTQILLYVKKERYKNKNFNGLKFWRSIKPILTNSKYEANKWKNIPMKYYKNIMILPEYYMDGYGNANIIEENHFLIQTVRIPKTEKPSLRKIMQIALNIGQYLGHNTKHLIKYKNIKDYISVKDMNVKLYDILSKTDMIKLKKKLTRRFK